MTGNNSTPAEKLRALFMAALMVLSVMAAGVAFTGSVGAAGNASDVTFIGQSAGNADVTTVGNNITVEVENVSAGATITVNNYVDGQLVQSVTADGPGTASSPVTLTVDAGKRGELRVLENGSRYVTNQTYTASNYFIDIKNNATYAQTDSVQVDGEIYRWYDPSTGDNLLEDTRNVDYAIYEPDNKTAGSQIVTGDTSNGQFTEVRTFSATTSATKRSADLDYPGDGEVVPSYEVFVNSDTDNNNAPTPDAGTNDGNAIIPVRLNFTLTGPTNVNYGETRDVTGSILDGDGNGVASYEVEVRNGSLSDTNIGAGKTRNTTTASDGLFGFTMEFNDAGIWSYGTNVGNRTDSLEDSLTYGSFEVDGQDAVVTLDTQGDVNRANFTHSYNVQVNDSSGNTLEVGTPSTEGYVNVTGPFSSFTVNDGTEVDRRISGGEIQYVHVQTNATGAITFDATPTGQVGSSLTAKLENSEGGDVFNGLENTQDAGDTPEFPDYEGSTTLAIVAPDNINVVDFRVQDPRTSNSDNFANENSGNYSDVINEFGPTDGGPELVEVLPLTFQNSSRIVNGERLGNDTFQDFDGMTAYRIRFALRDGANNPITPGTDPGEVSSISIAGAGVNGTVSGLDSNNDFDSYDDLSLDSGSRNILAFPKHASGTPADTYSIVVRPTNADEVDETLELDINVSGTGSAVDVSRSINVSGLYVDEFLVDGSQVETVEPRTTVNVSAVVRDKQEGDAFINNGRVRVSQEGSAIGQIDARTANVNNGEYEFTNLNTGPRGVDTNNDGIGDAVSELVFTAYQYDDANNDQALEQSEVDEATVETLALGIERDLNVTFLPDDNNTSPYVGTQFGQTVLTKGVEYDSLAFQLTDDGTPVNLTNGIDQRVSLNSLPERLVNVTAYDINGNPVTGEVTFNESESRPGDGYYVIEDIQGFNTIVSDASGDAAADGNTTTEDGVFSFYDFGATDEGPQQFWLRITTPSLSKATEDVATDPFQYSQGQFQVGDPQLETNVTGVAAPGINGVSWGDLAHDATDDFVNVSGIENLTIGINRTYRVNATYQSFTGEPIDGSAFDRAWIQYDGPLSGDGADTSFSAVSSAVNSPATVGGDPAVNLGDANGTFQFDLTVNTSGGDGVFTPQFTLTASRNTGEYGLVGSYGPNAPNASIVGTPTAQNPIVEVYDQSGSQLPENPAASSNNSVLANDVTQTLRVEAFPADADDEPLRGGLKFGVRNTNPVAENIVGTTTSTNSSDQPLVTNQFTGQNYEVGQIGFLTLTPTGTGEGIIQLINDNDGTGTTVQDTEANPVIFDVLRSNLQFNIDQSAQSVLPGDSVTVTLNPDSAPQSEFENVRVSLVNPSGNVADEALLNTSAQATLTVPASGDTGTYTIEARPAGYQPNSTELNVLQSASVTFNNQSSDGTSVEVASYSFGGTGESIAIWSVDNGTPQDVLGTRTSPSSGTDVEIDLDTPISSNQTLVAAVHSDPTPTANNIVEFDTAFVTVDIQQPATFEVSNLSAPASAQVGETITVTADVTNTGDIGAEKTVEFRFGGQTLLTQNVTLTASGQSGSSQQVTFDVPTSGVAPGNYTHGVYTPDDNETAQITIQQPATFEVSNLSAPASAETGETINVSADITNTGDVQGTETVEFRFAGSELANTTVTLNASETTTVDFSVDTSGVAPGNYTHGVFTPDDNETAQIEITGEADFEISDVNVPSNITQGDDLTAELNVTNVGNVAGSTPVSLSINGTNVSTGAGSADITFLIDTSTSMDNQIQSVKEGLQEFSSTLESQGVDARYAIVTFASGASEPRYTIVQNYTSSVSQTQQTLNNSVSTDIGGNEYSFDAINGTLNDLNERSSANEFLITLTDEDTEPGSNPSDPAVLADRLDNEGASLFAVTLPEGTENNLGQPIQGDLSVGRVANVSQNGQFFDIRDNFAQKFENEISGAVASAATGQTVSLNASESQTVTLTINGSNTQNLAPGNYTVELTAGDDSVNTTLVVEPASVTLPGASGPAQNIDSDSQLEDVDGDGTANVFDAIALYNNRNTQAVQNNPQFFDFDGDGQINVFDAIELYNEIS